MSARQFLTLTCKTEIETVSDPVAELNKRAAAYDTLLAHADDGVIWGRTEAGQLITADQALPGSKLPRLRAETLQEARLFGEAGEFYLWRTAEGWRGRTLTDNPSDTAQAYDEAVLLWGTDPAQEARGFTLVRETDQGLRHAPPLAWSGRRQMKLVMRHYLDFDKAGAAFVALSRLVRLT